VLLAIGLGWLLDHNPADRLRFDFWSILVGVGATLPMLLLFLVMLRWPIGPLRGIKNFMDTIIRPLMDTCSDVDLLGISVLAGVGEEMLFRGLVQDLFAGWLPLWLAVVLASLLFGIMHAVTPAYAVLAAFIGAYLGVIYLYTGNLLAPIIAHGLYDFIVLLFLVYGPEPPAPPAEEGDSAAATDEKPEDSSRPAPPSSL
jgi:membrane protease YdiL (CAAX protease family)